MNLASVAHQLPPQNTAIHASAAQSKVVSLVSASPVARGSGGGQQFVITSSKGAAPLLSSSASHPNAVQHQYIVTTMSPAAAPSGAVAGGGGAENGAVAASLYPGATLQYVVDGAAHGVYSTGGQSSMQYDYNQGANIYSPVGAAYHYGGNGGQQEISIAQGLSQHSQVVHQAGGQTYYIHGGQIVEGDGPSLSSATRASPATVQWLLDNYETAEGTSLPRSTLYTHYLRHCHDYKHDPMNPASFGKLIRSVFLGLRTRRLGTRGNSKYHYYGIRVKATSSLNQAVSDDMNVALRQSTSLQQKRITKPSVVANCDDSSQAHDKASSDAAGETSGPASVADSGGGREQHEHRDFLGPPPESVPSVAEVDLAQLPLPNAVTREHIRIFEQLYREHSEAILDVVVHLKFPAVETLWRLFWRRPEQHTAASESVEKILTKETLFALCTWEPVQTFVRRCDYVFYQALVNVLVPDVLRPIPSSLTQSIRNFAKNLEGWLTSAMQDAPEAILRTKVSAVAALSQTLRRYTSLNHLAQAARAVLQNPAQISQMVADLNRVDFANVQEQASWVCQCDDAMVSQLEQDFKNCLQQQQTLEEWADWLEEVVVDVLKLHDGAAGGSGMGSELPKVARLFLLKWSFYSSMVIRDLTLRSAASFGSFHLIRLLFDEYMFYIIEHRVATATGETPISIMGELNDLSGGGSASSTLSSSLDGASGPSPPNTPPSVHLNGIAQATGSAKGGHHGNTHVAIGLPSSGVMIAGAAVPTTSAKAIGGLPMAAELLVPKKMKYM